MDAVGTDCVEMVAIFLLVCFLAYFHLLVLISLDLLEGGLDLVVGGLRACGCVAGEAGP